MMQSEGLRVKNEVWGVKGVGDGIINLFKCEEQAGLRRAALEI